MNAHPVVGIVWPFLNPVFPHPMRTLDEGPRLPVYSPGRPARLSVIRISRAVTNDIVYSAVPVISPAPAKGSVPESGVPSPSAVVVNAKVVVVLEVEVEDVVAGADVFVMVVVAAATLGYGLVTAVLLAAYVGAVFVVRRLLPAQGGLAVAGSTLAVAALFNPLRRRIQTSVDRRFNRSHYDAVQVVDAFGARLRFEAGIDDLARDLLHTASAAMQPGSVSLWLKETPS